jgi:serine/threonine protein kinase
LQHKNIVKYYGVVRTDNYLHIVLEYCIGGSVAKLLETYKTLSESVIRKYAIQILEGLEYLHCHNIIHRDIKGANILVDRDGICKLSDFGGAKIVQEDIDIKKHSFKGTPNWMAPETVKKLEYTRFSDIWSLGCTIIEMATGKIILN